VAPTRMAQVVKMWWENSNAWDRWRAEGSAVAFQSATETQHHGSVVFQTLRYSFLNVATVKKSQVRSLPVKLITTTSDDIKSRQWTESEIEAVRKASEAQSTAATCPKRSTKTAPACGASSMVRTQY
jgi:hypothetical protein